MASLPNIAFVGWIPGPKYSMEYVSDTSLRLGGLGTGLLDAKSLSRGGVGMYSRLQVYIASAKLLDLIVSPPKKTIEHITDSPIHILRS
jgi:hypothetical protein